MNLGIGRVFVFGFGLVVGAALAAGGWYGFWYARQLGQRDVWSQAQRLHLAIETENGFEFTPPRPWTPRPVCKCATCRCSPCLCPVGPAPDDDELLVPARPAPLGASVEK